MDKKIYELALSLVKGIGICNFKKLIKKFGSAQQVINCSLYELKKLPFISYELASNIKNNKILESAYRLFLWHKKNGVKILSYYDNEYPKRLRNLPDPPIILYFKGQVDLNASHMVSVVGARKATLYGKEVVTELISALSMYGVSIVSGLACGIDKSAHDASIQCHLPTIGVLANGLDISYPKVHTSFISEIIKSGGGLISEYPLQTKPKIYHFPQRNRIIAGISDLTIVIEAGIRSGALITARLANEYNREVMVVPGRIHDMYSAGCNFLIRSHQAHLLTGIDDIVSLMGWKKKYKNKEPIKSDELLIKEMSALERKIYFVIKDNTVEGSSIELLSETLKTSKSLLLSELLQLELRNIIQIFPGGKIKLKNCNL